MSCFLEDWVGCNGPGEPRKGRYFRVAQMGKIVARAGHDLGVWRSK